MTYGVHASPATSGARWEMSAAPLGAENCLSQDGSLYGDVVGRLKQMIESGVVQPEEQLPTETQLAASLGIPAVAVRRALRGLARDGVLESPKEMEAVPAFSVSDMSGFVSGFARSIANRKTLLLDVLQARLATEPHLAELAATHATELEVLQLERVVKQQMIALQEGGTGEEEDRAFHAGIAKAAGNGVLQEFSLHLAEQVSDLRDLMFQDNRWQKASMESHRAIVKALQKRDGVGAYVAMRRHLTEANMLVSVLEM